MTGRERLLAILNNEPTDRLAWTVLTDDATRVGMPEEVAGMGQIDFHRLLGCDILLFGCYGLTEFSDALGPCALKSPSVRDSYSQTEDGIHKWVRDTDWGSLTALFQNGHPIKYPVETLDDVSILKQIWSCSSYEEQPECSGSYARILEALGDSGIYAETMMPSPVQQLIETEMGLSTFYCLLNDYQSEIEELLEVMHTRRLEEYEIVGKRSLADVVISVENTSSLLTSPSVYAKYSLPQIRDYVSVLHSHGKKSILHMCGHLKHLLSEIRKTGLDGVHALTPPPVGDTHIEEALDILGEDIVILGGLLPPEVFHKTTLNYSELSDCLHSIYTPRVRNANFLLCAGADGLPTTLDRFHMLRDWFAANGHRQ